MYWARYSVGTAVAFALLGPAIFLAGGVVTLAIVLGCIGVAILIVTFAPALPRLNTLPRIGAPQIEALIGIEGAGDPPTLIRIWNIDECVLRVGFVNRGPARVENVLVNVLVDNVVEIVASDPEGAPEDRGAALPLTVEDDRPMKPWTEREAALPVGGTMFHYRLRFPEPEEVGDRFLVRVRYSADGLYGHGDRIEDRWVRVVDLRASGGEGHRPLLREPASQPGEDREVGVEPNAVESSDAEREE